MVCALSIPHGAAAARKTNTPPQAAGKPSKAPDALVGRLCDALHTLPEARKIECCGTSPTGSLAGACKQTLGAAIARKAVALDPAEIDRCAAESAQRLQGCDWVTPLMPRLPPACQAVVRGLLDREERCQSSLECRDGLFCLGGGNGTVGVCASPSPPGMRCGGGPDLLETYARETASDPRHPECAGFCRSGRCAAALAIGEACSSSDQCAAGNRCQAGHCVAGAPPALGEACDGTTCAGDLICLDGRCAPPKKAGEACSKAFECAASCITAPGTTAGTCGMRCTSWPPAGYTPPHYPSPEPAQAKRAK